MPLTVAHIVALKDNLDEVTRLSDIHTKLTGTKRGNRSSVNVLNKSGVILAVACWEVFIEDVARTAFEKMLISTDDPKIFPVRVLSLASEDLIQNSNHAKVWELAGKGWKRVLRKHKDKILNNYLGNFNTAKTKQIDALFKDLVGLKNLSSFWHWPGLGNKRACSRIDNLVTMRGDIAHRVKTSRTVLKSDVDDAVEFISNLAAITSNRVASYVHSKIGKRPWATVSYGSRQ